MTNKELYLKALSIVGKETLERKTKAFLNRLIAKAEAEAQNLNIAEHKIKQAHDILSDLNSVCRGNFRPVSTNLNLIYARMAEDYTVDDFKKVHRLKAAQWLGDEKFQKYLRPETLYRPTHFASYLNEAESMKAGAPVIMRHWFDYATLDELIKNRAGLDIPEEIKRLYGKYSVFKGQKDYEMMNKLDEKYKKLIEERG